MVLEVHNLHVYYGQSHVIRDVSLAVNRGEVVGYMGRNGAGKTTTIHALGGILPIAEGSVSLRGSDIASMRDFERAQLGLGIVPSEGRLFGSLTVEENFEICSPGELSGARYGYETHDVYELFPELAEMTDRRAGVLSGGERQMVAIGRALLMSPAVLIMDEPSEGLAPSLVERISEALSTIRNAGVGILLCEHNEALVRELASRVYFLEKGTIRDEADLDEAERNDLFRTYLTV